MSSYIQNLPQNLARLWAAIEAAKVARNTNMLSVAMLEFAQLRMPANFVLARSTITTHLSGLTDLTRMRTAKVKILILTSYIFRIWKSFDTFPLSLAGVLCKAVVIGTQEMEWYEVSFQRVREIICDILHPTKIVEFSISKDKDATMSKAISIEATNLKTGFYSLAIHNYKVWCIVICNDDAPPTVYISYVWARLLAMENPHMNGSDIAKISLTSLKGLVMDPRLSCSGGLCVVRWEDALTYIRKAYRKRPFDKRRLASLVEKSKIKNLLAGSQFPQLLMDIPSYLRDVEVKAEEMAIETDEEEQEEEQKEKEKPVPAPLKRKRKRVEKDLEEEEEEKEGESPSISPPPIKHKDKRRRIETPPSPAPLIQTELLSHIKNYGEMIRELMKKI